MKTTAVKKSKPGKPANYSLVLPPEILERLENLARATNRSKAFYIKEALRAHLDVSPDARCCTRDWPDLLVVSLEFSPLRCLNGHATLRYGKKRDRST